MCELDVLATRDGTLVVIHDESVDRTTDGRGAVSDLTLAEIRQLDAGAKFNERFRGERIPTLDEVMKAVRGKVGLNIEIKESGLERKVCELLRSHQMLDDLNGVELRLEGARKDPRPRSGNPPRTALPKKTATS